VRERYCEISIEKKDERSNPELTMKIRGGNHHGRKKIGKKTRRKDDRSRKLRTKKKKINKRGYRLAPQQPVATERKKNKRKEKKA
jgi:hypothetical protein